MDNQMFLSQGTSELYRAQVGYPIGYFWGFKIRRSFSGFCRSRSIYKRGKQNITLRKMASLLIKIKPGDARMVDMNGDTIINDKDKVQIGDPHPDVILGLQIRCRV